MVMVEVKCMDGTKKIAVAVLTVALVALGVAVAYGYYVSTAVPSNYGAYGTYGPYGNSAPNGYGAYGSTGPYSNYGPNGSYGPYSNAGPYGNNYGQWGGHMGGGMMGGYGMGMR
jgi:hypothetical protein